jgi:Ctr copper transporter family
MFRALALSLASLSERIDYTVLSTGVQMKNDINHRRQISPPFLPAHDVPRGILQMINSSLHYALMLAVMYVVVVLNVPVA